MKSRSLLTLLLLFLAVSLTAGLMACGGGGGGGGISYNGVTTQAQITEQNAAALALGTWLSGDTGTNVDIFGAVQTNPEFFGDSLTFGAMPNILENIIFELGISSFAAGTYAGAVQTVHETIDGSCGGTATVTGNANDQTGAINATVNFSSYCEEDVSINGRANLTGTIDPASEELTDFTLSFSSLSMVEADESITINGSFSANYAVFPMLVTMSYVLRDNNLMKTYWLRDAQFQLDGQMDYVDISGMTGRYYDPDYGYVELSVGAAIRIYDYANWPSSGSFILTGAKGTAGGETKVRLVFLNSNEYRVDADTNGDGVYNYSEGPYAWSGEIVLKSPYIFSENVAFSDFFTSSGLTDSYFMRTNIQSDTPDRSIFIQDDSMLEQIPYMPILDLLSAPYFSYVKTLIAPYGPPGVAWEGKDYTFFIDDNGNSSLDYGEAFLQCSVPWGAIIQMDIPAVTVTGGSSPTISWQSVADADRYVINFFELTPQNRLGNIVFTTVVAEEGTASSSYTYNGDLFNQYAMLAIGVVARDEHSACVLNRSLYYTVHSK